MRPICAGQDGTHQPDKDNEQNHAAAAATARAAAPKTESVLQPVENSIDQKEFQQARETPRTIMHFILLVKRTVEFNMKYENSQKRAQLKWR
jgi:hypothetical protein